MQPGIVAGAPAIPVKRHFGSNPLFAKHLLEATNPISDKSCETLKHKFAKYQTLQARPRC